MTRFPFISLSASIIALRIGVAFIFLAHAVIRISGGTIERFGGFLNAKGFIIGEPLVWAITAYEIAGAMLMALGYFTRWLAAGFVLILMIGIFLIHIAQGWFVGEHGTGGVEYSFVLILALLVIAAHDRTK